MTFDNAYYLAVHRGIKEFSYKNFTLVFSDDTYAIYEDNTRVTIIEEDYFTSSEFKGWKPV